MLQYLVPILLGLAHGVADGSVGLQLGHLPGTQSLARVGLLVLLYNLLAFGGQPFAGALAAGLALGLAIAAGGLPATFDAGPALAKPPALAALTLSPSRPKRTAG